MFISTNTITFSLHSLQVTQHAMLQGADSVVLIAWQHEDIACIANTILRATGLTPTWCNNRFDVVWVFDFVGGSYTFTQVPQNLLSGDTNTIISHSDCLTQPLTCNPR